MRVTIAVMALLLGNIQGSDIIVTKTQVQRNYK